jgi:hypothetical protein
MRTERPTPWGFDIWDPRLEQRRAAAEAQRGGAFVEAPASDDSPILDDETPFDWPALEAVGAGARDNR